MSTTVVSDNPPLYSLVAAREELVGNATEQQRYESGGTEFGYAPTQTSRVFQRLLDRSLAKSTTARAISKVRPRKDLAR